MRTRRITIAPGIMRAGKRYIARYDINRAGAAKTFTKTFDTMREAEKWRDEVARQNPRRACKTS